MTYKPTPLEEQMIKAVEASLANPKVAAKEKKQQSHQLFSKKEKGLIQKAIMDSILLERSEEGPGDSREPAILEFQALYKKVRKLL